MPQLIESGMLSHTFSVESRRLMFVQFKAQEHKQEGVCYVTFCSRDPTTICWGLLGANFDFQSIKEGLHTRHPKDWSSLMVETEKFLDRIREKKNVWQTKKTSARFHGFFLWMPLWGLSSMLWLLGLLFTARTFPLSWVDTTQRIRISAKVHPQKVTHCYRGRQVSLCPWKTLQMLQSDVNEGATDLSQTRHTVGVYSMLNVNICFCKG